jgi:hypothetical protein
MIPWHFSFSFSFSFSFKWIKNVTCHNFVIEAFEEENKIMRLQTKSVFNMRRVELAMVVQLSNHVDILLR